MKAGCLVKYRAFRLKADTMGLIVETAEVIDSVALVDWFNGTRCWVKIETLEEIT